ncbi:MAG: hypothetical protein II393_02035 [Cytophagales bacterium]|nr:hypothetical protein [Cytophagales bacterium]
MRVYKISIVILLLHCGWYDVCCYDNNKNIQHQGIDANPLDENQNKASNLFKYSNFAFSILSWKLCPWCFHITKPHMLFYYYVECFYGATNGLGWYPNYLKFKRGKIKIGFLLLEHRSWEILFRLVELLTLKETNPCAYLFSIGIAPLSLSILSIKWKYLRMNMFSIIELLVITCNISRINFCFARKANDLFFRSNVWPWIVFLLPRLSIDLSYFYP